VQNAEDPRLVPPDKFGKLVGRAGADVLQQFGIFVHVRLAPPQAPPSFRADARRSNLIFTGLPAGPVSVLDQVIRKLIGAWLPAGQLLAPGLRLEWRKTDPDLVFHAATLNARRR
jgi:hypothetical protein